MPWSYESLGPYISQGLGVPFEKLSEVCRPAVETDLAQVLALRRAVAGDGMWWDDHAFVRWRYFDNVTGDGAVPYWVVWKGDEIVGGCGLEPVVLVVDGEAHPAMRTLDIMIRPDLQGSGLGAFLNMVLFRHFSITMVTGSNAASHQLLSRMFTHVLDFKVWKLLVGSREVVERHLGSGPFSGAAAAVADRLLALARLARRRPPPAGLTIREMTSFDDRVTELSRQCEGPGRLLVRRGADYLNWRFVHNPRCRYRMLGAFDEDRLVGYLVTRFNLARPNPRREAEIVDWLALPGAGGAAWSLPHLMQAGVNRLVRQGARLITCAAFDSTLEPVMNASGFVFRPDERLPFFVQAGRTSLHDRLSSADAWFLTRGDFDIE